MSTCAIRELHDILLKQGKRTYADSVTHLDHALHCATLAEREGSPAWLVTAALTHDIGHLIHAPDNFYEGRVEDDNHERVGAYWLRARFDARVADTVAAHVEAKRYLCSTEPGYMRALSPGCRLSLTLQGGPMCSAEIHQFEQSPLFKDALRIRRWEERPLKRPMDPTLLEHFLETARLALLPSQRGWT
jgi:predicted HD phosphohydrolase